MPTPQKDYYKILRDANKSPDAAWRTQEINEADEVLNDPLRRAQEDHLRRQAKAAQRQKVFNVIGLIILVGFAFIVGSLSTMVDSDSSTPTVSSSVIKEASGDNSSPIPSSTERGTRETQQANSLVLTPPSDWTWQIRDDFSANTNDWGVGKNHDSQGRNLLRQIRESKYYWTSNSLKGSFWTAFGPLADLSLHDYLVSVDVELVEGAPDGVESGFLLNGDTTGDYFYAFGIFHDGAWHFNRFDGEWRELSAARSTTIQVKGTNRLSVYVMDGSFTLFINGEKVGYVEDSKIPSGSVGLFLGARGSDKPVIVTFDNFEIQGQPPSQMYPFPNG